MSKSRYRPNTLVLAVGTLALLVVFALVFPTATLSADESVKPPGGIYTCAWIQKNPDAAAEAHVTCDPATFFGPIFTPDPVRIQAQPLSQGCANVPSSGSVGQGVYAWSSYQYSTYWGWYAYNSPSDYTWYLQTSGGANYVYGDVYDTSNHYVGVPANIYRWGAQNHSSTAQRWYVCWNDN